jgi:ABC-type lipoprotein release transport system permease subunit
LAIQSLLYGVTAGDVLAWILAPMLLLAVALLAGFSPAAKAGRLDPAITLRGD